MIVVGVPRRSYVISPAKFGANAAQQTAGKSAAQNLRGHFQRRIVLIAILAPQLSDIEESLGDVGLSGEKYTGRRLGLHLWKRGNLRLRVLPIAQKLLQLGLHVVGGEIAVNFENDVGREVVAMIEIHQILAVDGIHIGVFDPPAIRRVAAVNNVAELALHDTAGVIVSARNLAAQLCFGQLHFVFAEFGGGEEILENLKHLAGVFLQAIEGQRSTTLADLAFHRRGHVLQLFIHLIARLGFGAPRA